MSPLGKGGMGEVYRARDTRLDRDVAVKVLPSDLAADPDALARFEREAKAVAALSHPNILAIHDFGREGEIVYAVMELLEGRTLRKTLDAGPIPQRQAFDYALQIAKGLSAAHEKDIVHRDLKPENVFVMRDAHVKILDFGLAKRLETKAPAEETSAPTSSGTQSGTVVGTLGYMSPEQVRGEELDRRSDIFSFGAILYELISGKKAFQKSTASDTIVAILRDPAPELSDSGRGVSPFVDQIVRHCLEKDREERFQSAKDVAFALGEASSSAGGSASGFRPAYAPAARWARTRYAVAAVALAAIAAAILLLRTNRQPATPPAPTGPTRIAVLPFENLGAPADDYFADGVADEVRGKLTALPGLQVIARNSSTPYKKTTKTPKQIAAELNVSYLLTATLRWEKVGDKNRVHVSPELVDVTRPDAPTSKWQQSFDAALTDVFQVQSDIAARVAQALGVALGAGDAKRLSEKPTENLAAYDAFLKGEEASNRLGATDPPTMRKALAFYEQAVSLDPTFLLAWQRVSGAASSLYANAVPTPELAARAKESAEKTLALAPSRPEGYVALGNYYRLVADDAPKALEQFEAAQRAAPGSADPLRGIALAEQSMGRWEAAVGHFRESERLDPRSVPGWTSIGSALLRLRRYAEPREALDRGLAVAPTNLRLIENRAMTYLGEGDLAGARASIAAALKTSSVDPGALIAYLANYNDLVWVLDEAQRELLLRLGPSAFDGDRGTWAMALAQAYALRGDATKVHELAEEATKQFAQQAAAAPTDAGRRVSYGLSLAYLGRKDDAIREGESGLQLSPVSKDARTGAYYEHQLVRIEMLAGEPEKAIDRLERLLKIPYYVSPKWLAIDPNFDSLRKNPRFERLIAGG
ncbi:MAG TPA: protein kinase [Thermoanaerobaculia bacterium]